MYNDPTDPFAHLRAIAAGQPINQQMPKFWNYERDGNILGIIVGFSNVENPKYGVQHTLLVRLADTNELVSAFTNLYLQEGLRRKQANVGDLILIQYLGKDSVQGFNRFNLEIEKPQPQAQYHSTQQPPTGW